MYGWNYSWEQIRELYIQKNKEYSERVNALCSFAVELVSAALGGGKKDEDYGLDNGDGIDEMSDAQMAEMKEMLGEDFEKAYGKFD